MHSNADNSKIKNIFTAAAVSSKIKNVTRMDTSYF